MFDDVLCLPKTSNDQPYPTLPLLGRLGPMAQFWFIVGLMLFLSFGFTALHLSAWNYNFPTSTEKWMWRGSAISFGATPFAINLCLLLMGIIDPNWVEQNEEQKAKKKEEKNQGGPLSTGSWHLVRDILFWSFFFMFCVLTLFYVSARAFIIIESFISFRRAPAGIYQKVDWTSYWAHIGN